jgi:hypothetical protein
MGLAVESLERDNKIDFRRTAERRIDRIRDGLQFPAFQEINMQTLNAEHFDKIGGGDFWGGAAIVAGAILAVALAPVEIPIASVAGVAALATEVAGAGEMLQ